MNLHELTLIAADVVAATQRKLPPELAAIARNVPVHYAATPEEDVLAEGFEDDILGLFTGPPHGVEPDPAQPLLPQILLYLENLWDFAEEDVPAFRYEAARAASTPASVIRARRAASIAGEGLSSITFW